MPESNKKISNIFSGCDDLLNDLSLPEEHKNRFVSIDLTSKTGNGNSITSSPTSTPGARNYTKGSKSEQTQSKRAWERAIDKYVASVLEDENEATGESSSTLKVSNTPGNRSSAGSQKSARSNRSHPDNHLLAALQRDMASDRPSSSCSVDIDGHIDDSSFAPINPFDVDNDEDSDPIGSSRLKRVMRYIKDERKPISLIALVVLVTIIVSVSLNNRGSSSSGGSKSETPGYAIDNTLNNDIKMIPTTKITEAPSSEYPTYTPTLGEEEESKSIIMTTTTTTTAATTTTTMKATTAVQFFSPNKPTSSPVPAPTSKPTVEPTVSMPAEYFEMKKAAIYVTGSKEPFEKAASPQSLAFNWLFHEGNPSKNLFEFFEQYATAVLFFSLTQARTLYAVMNNVTERVYDSWMDKTEVCGWEGVRCAYNYTSEMIHVTEIRLSNMNLTGAIANEIEFLPYLNRLDLSDNKVSGTVPTGVYELKRLRCEMNMSALVNAMR